MRLSEYRVELRRLLARSDRLNALMEGVSRILQAKGCAYWALFPRPVANSDFKLHPDRFRLFTVASWFVPGASGETEFFGYYDVPLSTSNVGDAVLTEIPVSGFDPRLGANVHPLLPHPLRPDPILQSRNVSYLAAAPVYDGDLIIGALSIYSNTVPPVDWLAGEENAAWMKAEAETLEDVAVFVPILFDAAIGDQRSSAVGGVADVLRDAEIGHIGKALAEEETKQHLRSLAERLATIFNCSEVTIFLRYLEEGDAERAYWPVASTWLRPEELKPHQGDEKEGLTGWVLNRGKPVWIADLRTFERDKEYYRRLFPGISHRNSLSLDYSKGSFPISFIAAPVMIASKVMGCIRCCSKPDEGRHYNESDAVALSYACSLLGTAWHLWQTNAAMDRETRAWKKFLKRLESASGNCLDILQDKPTQERVLQSLLSVVQEFIPEAGTPSVHLVRGNYLRQVFPSPKTDAVDERFRIDDGSSPVISRALAVRVFRTKTTQYFPDVRDEPQYAGTIEGDETQSLIICPIVLEGGKEHPMGVLSVRSRRQLGDSEFAQQLAATLALQVGIILRFLETIQDARKIGSDAQKTADAFKQQQGVLRRVFEDIRHQIKAPLDKAVMRIDGLMSNPRIRTEDRLRRDTAVVRGLCRKAAAVARSVKLLADIEAGRSVSPNVVPLDYDTVMRLFIQMAEDHENESDPEKPVRFDVSRDGLEKIPWGNYQVDLQLLEQALFCLCDNALKYSYSNTTVTIAAKVSQSGKLRITVSNHGSRLTVEESRRVLLRGERGWAAREFRGEGSGIGLFLVNQIALAHRGSFRMMPTDDAGLTIAELLLP